MYKKEEFEQCLNGIICNEKECKRLRDYWGYTLGFEFTVSISNYDFIFTITNKEAKVYGW